MNVFVMEIANIKFKVSCLYDSTRLFCREYIIEDDDYDFYIEMNDELIQKEKEYITDGIEYKDEYLETIALYRRIGEIIPSYDGFVLHGAAIEYKNKCIVFVAPSGTGKTTHINLWRKHLPDLKIINGDKPIIRLIDDKPYVFGTPWMGKEHIGNNSSCLLNSVVILKRGDSDCIKKVNKADYIQDLLSKVYISRLETFDLIDRVYKNIDVYEFHCTMNESAFITCFEKLMGEKYEG